ncbi:HNH endonuclease family protein [uncultured Amnibacterium sp.]|uniref:HNH endonuclease family protein n=1 Tax=uncultured Amnibacterium sp. TaxID=1631851 RepID=UPI0035CAC181
MVVLVAGPVHAADAAPKTVSARSLLAQLRVAQPDSAHRYQRAEFHYDDEWDADGDGCYTRKEVLIRDAISIDHVSRSCAVYGRWRSLYDGRITSNPNTLEVDHLVPLAEAWHAGAWSWSSRKKIAFGNDLGYRWELQPVTASLNQAKEDDDPAGWMPPKNRCTYVAAWIGVKARWHLTVDPAEKAALVRWLDRCGDVKVQRPGTPDVAKLSAGGPLED